MNGIEIKRQNICNKNVIFKTTKTIDISWGRGFEKIKNECKKYNTPIPEIDIKTSGVMI